MIQTSVKDIYKQHAAREWRRLVKDPYHRLEFDTTLHFLKKYLPAKGLILDAGGGPGRYTIELAKLGYEVVLLDYTPELLKIAKRQISRAGVKNLVQQIVEGSIVDLSQFPDNHFDAVLCLGGPVSHLANDADRNKAVSELFRVAKSTAPVFISVMGKLAVLMDAASYWPEEISQTSHWRDIWQRGEDEMWHHSSYCHFFTALEFQNLIAPHGRIIEYVGLEGLAHNRKAINSLEKKFPGAFSNWWEMHLSLCTDPAVFATSSHMLIIATK